MKQVKITDKDFIDELERLQDVVQSYQSLLSYMINNGTDIYSESFQNYQKEYQKSFKSYEQKKYEVELKYIQPYKATNWNLDFKTGVLTIQ